MASSSSVTGATFLGAARSGDLRLVKELASKLDDGGEGTFDKIRDIEGLTALHYAAAARNTHRCKYLNKQLKLDVNAQDVQDIGVTFLEAARSGDLRLLKKLVAKLGDGGEGSFAKIRDIEGLTALHVAAGAGNTHICKYLIRQLKFDVNVQDEEGHTPLVYATLMQRLQTASYLVDNGASIAKTNTMGFTPLHCAAVHGGKDLLQLFISRGANIEAESGAGTPLACASCFGNREAVEVLLQNNANPNPVNCFEPPVIISSQTSVVCTDLLVKAGADPNVNFAGVTPLHSAVAGERVEIIMYLLNAGANPDVLDFIGLTPLENAALLGNFKAMSILFPVTSPIPTVPDWSISGLIKYMNSGDAMEKIIIKTKQTFIMAKSKGEEAFNRGDYWDAMNWYTRAIKADPSDAKVLSNRSLCHARLHLDSRALSDAKACVRLRPDWPKAHYREGVAWKLLKNYHEAANSFSRALQLDPNNNEVQKALREAVEAEIEGMGI